MKRVTVANPTPAGRLAVVNPTTTKRPKKSGQAKAADADANKKQKRNPSRVKKNPTLLGKQGLLAQATAAAIGGLVTTTVCGMLPLPTSPLLNIGAKVGIAYLLNLAAEQTKFTEGYAAALGSGGAAIAASDALKIAIPAFRTAYVGTQPVIAQVAPAPGLPPEPVAIAGYDEFGDIIELGDVIELSDDEDEMGDMGDIITVSPEWR